MNRRQRNRPGRGILLGCLLTLFGFASAAEAQNLVFVYVAPTANMVADFGAASIVGVGTAGYRGVVLDAATEADFRTNAPADLVKMFDALQPGTALRRRVDVVRNIAGAKVDVELFLVDDRTLLSRPSTRFATRPHGSNQWIVWPATFLFQIPSSPQWVGRVAIGQLAIDALEATLPGNWTGVEAVFLHEFSHSQMIETGSFGDFSKWGTWKGNPSQWITYGRDGLHQSEEILGDQAAALDEGLGNFFFHLHNPAAHQSVTDFFREPDYRYVLEAQSVMAGAADLYRAPRKRDERADGSVFWDYKWRDIPGWYLLFSESTSTGYFFYFWQYAHDDKAEGEEWVMGVAKAMHETRLKRYLTYAVNQLALQMEAHAATPDGQADKAAGTLVSSLFPFALLDVLTDFDMSEERYKKDYKRNRASIDPKALAAYWPVRASLEAIARPHLDANPIEIEKAIEAIRRELRNPKYILEP